MAREGFLMCCWLNPSHIFNSVDGSYQFIVALSETLAFRPLASFDGVRDTELSISSNDENVSSTGFGNSHSKVSHFSMNSDKFFRHYLALALSQCSSSCHFSFICLH